MLVRECELQIVNVLYVPEGGFVWLYDFVSLSALAQIKCLLNYWNIEIFISKKYSQKTIHILLFVEKWKQPRHILLSNKMRKKNAAKLRTALRNTQILLGTYC